MLVFSQNRIKQIRTGTCLFSLAVPLHGQTEELKIISVNTPHQAFSITDITQSKGYSESGVDPNETDAGEKKLALKRRQAEVVIALCTSSSLAEELGISCVHCCDT